MEVPGLACLGICEGLAMGARSIGQSLERWHKGEKELRRRMILAPSPQERER